MKHLMIALILLLSPSIAFAQYLGPKWPSGKTLAQQGPSGKNIKTFKGTKRAWGKVRDFIRSSANPYKKSVKVKKSLDGTLNIEQTVGDTIVVEPTPNPDVTVEYEDADVEVWHACEDDPSVCAHTLLRDGVHLKDITIDATGFLYGVEMSEVGTATLTNVIIKNAGPSTNLEHDPDQHGHAHAHGLGRGLIVTGEGAKMVVIGGSSNNNAQDGYVATNGGELEITDATADNNGTKGFAVEDNGKMTITNGSATGNIWGVWGHTFGDLKIHGGDYKENDHEGVNVNSGEDFLMDGGTSITSNKDWWQLAVTGVKNAKMVDTNISPEGGNGIYVRDSKLVMEGVSSANSAEATTHSHDGGPAHSHGLTALGVWGDSTVDVTTSDLTGKCFEGEYGENNLVGVITVDGEEVPGNQDCPQ